jgi:hypothetical protein
VFHLEHYLDVLDKKPGALPGSRPLAQWRAQGLWPECLDRLWSQWQERLGKPAATRALVDLLLLARVQGWSAVKTAAEKALLLGCTDESAVQCLLAQAIAETEIPPLSAEDLGSLSRYERPLPEISGYDQLLAGERAASAPVGGGQ